MTLQQPLPYLRYTRSQKNLWSDAVIEDIVMGLKDIWPPYTFRPDSKDSLETLLFAPDLEMYRARTLFGKAETLHELLRRFNAWIWIFIIRVDSHEMANRMIDLGMSIDDQFTLLDEEREMTIYDVICHQKCRHWQEWMLTSLDANKVYGIPQKESTLLCHAFFWKSESAFWSLMYRGANPYIRLPASRGNIPVYELIRNTMTREQHQVRFQQMLLMPIMVMLCAPRRSPVYDHLPIELLHCLRFFLY